MIPSRSFLAAWRIALPLLRKLASERPPLSVNWNTDEGVCCMVTLFFRMDWRRVQEERDT